MPAMRAFNDIYHRWIQTAIFLTKGLSYTNYMKRKNATSIIVTWPNFESKFFQNRTKTEINNPQSKIILKICWWYKLGSVRKAEQNIFFFGLT